MKNVLSIAESRASGRKTRQSKEVQDLLMNDILDAQHCDESPKPKIRCTLFPWLDYVAGVAVPRIQWSQAQAAKVLL